MNASGGVPANTSSGTGFSTLRGEGVGRREQVPVEVHGGLRLAGGARGEGDHRHVIGGRLHRGELGGFAGGQRDQVGRGRRRRR